MEDDHSGPGQTDVPELHVRMESEGYMLLAKGEMTAAIRMFRRLTRYFPYSSRAHVGLGEAYFKGGVPSLAREKFSRALELDPDNERAITRLHDWFGAEP